MLKHIPGTRRHVRLSFARAQAAECVTELVTAVHARDPRFHVNTPIHISDLNPCQDDRDDLQYFVAVLAVLQRGMWPWDNVAVSEASKRLSLLCPISLDRLERPAGTPAGNRSPAEPCLCQSSQRGSRPPMPAPALFWPFGLLQAGAPGRVFSMSLPVFRQEQPWNGARPSSPSPQCKKRMLGFVATSFAESRDPTGV